MTQIPVRGILFLCCAMFAATVLSQVAEPAQSAAPSTTAASPKVVMYATHWCPYCAKARAHFRNNGIVYVEHDIETSPAGRAEYQQLGGRGVPLILVGEQRMTGFAEARFDELYASKRR